LNFTFKKCNHKHLNTKAKKNGPFVKKQMPKNNNG
jgi:hypothetical protein